MAKLNIPSLKYLTFLAIPLLWWGSSAFTSGWLNPSFQSENFEFLQFAVHPLRSADYGIDPFTSQMAPIDPSIIEDTMQDNGSGDTTTNPTTPPVTPTPRPDDEDESEDDQGGQVSTPAPTTDPGNNGNGGNGNGGNGNGGENGNGGGNGNGGNGNGGDNGNGGGNDKDKGPKEEGLVPGLFGLLASL